MKELTEQVIRHIEGIIQAVAEDVQDDIQKALGEYYAEYDPKRYKRVDHLKKCCVISDPRKTKDGISIDVYLDINSLQYSTKGADPYKTVVAADVGLHGGWDVFNEEVVPWDDIKHKPEQKTGSMYGGTSIWTDPVDKMIQDGSIAKWFKQHALERGLKLIEI